ncbi:MAG: GxxExxY protein [Ferruginibacter sp.]
MVMHEGIDMGIGFKPDLIAGGKLIIELKSVERLEEVHYKQPAHLSEINRYETWIADKLKSTSD